MSSKLIYLLLGHRLLYILQSALHLPMGAWRAFILNVSEKEPLFPDPQPHYYLHKLPLAFFPRCFLLGKGTTISWGPKRSTEEVILLPTQCLACPFLSTLPHFLPCSAPPVISLEHSRLRNFLPSFYFKHSSFVLTGGWSLLIIWVCAQIVKNYLKKLFLPPHGKQICSHGHALALALPFKKLSNWRICYYLKNIFLTAHLSTWSYATCWYMVCLPHYHKNLQESGVFYLLNTVSQVLE